MLSVTRHTHRIVGLATAFAVVLLALPALADRVIWKKTTIEESGESWKVELEIHLSKAPDIAHVPMQFKFEPKVYYERSLLDGSDEPQLRKVPLTDRQPLIETVDMGFLDPGSGKIQKRTRFSFKLTRDRGFEAGEYTVEIRNKRTDRKLGPPKALKLNGENEVIDRRSMDFSSGSKKKKKEDKPAESQEDEYDASKDPNSEEYWESGPTEPERGDEPLPPPAHMQEKPGACGCRVAGERTPGSDLGIAAILLALGMVVRRARGR